MSCFFCVPEVRAAIGGGSRLLFELDAFEGEEVLGAEDGVLEGAVRVVQAGGGGEGGFLLRERALKQTGPGGACGTERRRRSRESSRSRFRWAGRPNWVK